MSTKALVDGDIVIYRCGFASENDDEGIAVARTEEMMQGILAATSATDHCVYFSGSRDSTFRAHINPEYKANRTQPKPKHYNLIKQFLKDEYNTVQEVDQEADDGLGIEQCANAVNTIICSIDKDLLQIPGDHYNFVRNEFYHVTPEDGMLLFYKQLLMGDATDNIKGVAGIGQAKSNKILAHLFGADEVTLFNAVQAEYRRWLENEWSDGWDEFKEKQMNNIITVNGICLKIRTEENEIWKIPTESTTSPEMVQES